MQRLTIYKITLYLGLTDLSSVITAGEAEQTVHQKYTVGKQRCGYIYICGSPG